MATTAQDWSKTNAGRQLPQPDLLGEKPPVAAPASLISVYTNLTVAKSTDEEKLNKTERAWLGELRRLNYPYIGIQNMTLKLGDDTRYTPDFCILDANGQLVFHEVKGFMRDDARVKIMVAARMYPIFRFVLITKEKPLGWNQLPIKP